MEDSRQRRRLRFNSIAEALAEADRLVVADRAGKLTCVGKWTLGQAIGHLATWAEFAFDGYPLEVQAPLPVRLLLRLFRPVILRNGMTTGVKIGKLPGGTLGLELIETEPALERLRVVFGKLEKASPQIANPAFGIMTHEQWIQLNLRHAELHLGFQIP